MDTPRADDKVAALSVSSSSLVGASDGPKASSAGILGHLVISINDGKFMTLQQENLVVQIEGPSDNPATFCGIPLGYQGKTRFPVDSLPSFLADSTFSSNVAHNDHPAVQRPLG